MQSTHNKEKKEKSLGSAVMNSDRGIKLIPQLLQDKSHVFYDLGSGMRCTSMCLRVYVCVFCVHIHIEHAFATRVMCGYLGVSVLVTTRTLSFTHTPNTRCSDESRAVVSARRITEMNGVSTPCVMEPKKHFVV